MINISGWFRDRRRLLIGLLGILLAGAAVWLALDTVDSHGTCRTHHMYRTYDGTHDGDGDGVGCESLPEPPSRRSSSTSGSSSTASSSTAASTSTSTGYDRANWSYNSSSARDALGCDSSEHVDHVVALKEAYDSGASRWTNARKSTFANDRANQWCLDAGVNISKSDHDLAEWSGGTCQQRKHIATVTVAIKETYRLSIDPAEQSAINVALAAQCSVPQTSSTQGSGQGASDTSSVDVPQDDFPAGRISARRVASGRTEFAWLTEDDVRVFPRARFFPANATVGRWLTSSPIVVDGQPIGRISARRVSSGAIEFSIVLTDGERFLPRGRFFPAGINHSRWLKSTLIDPDS